jgi:hypothetical protein
MNKKIGENIAWKLKMEAKGEKEIKEINTIIANDDADGANIFMAKVVNRVGKIKGCKFNSPAAIAKQLQFNWAIKKDNDYVRNKDIVSDKD